MKCQSFYFYLFINMKRVSTFSYITTRGYSNILEILPPKNEKFHIKILIFFIFLLKTKIVSTGRF